MMSGLPTAPLASRLINQRPAAPWITLRRKAKLIQLEILSKEPGPALLKVDTGAVVQGLGAALRAVTCIAFGRKAPPCSDYRQAECGVPVSYTHLDVYKRQARALRRRREAGTVEACAFRILVTPHHG